MTAEDSFSFYPELIGGKSSERPAVIHHSVNGTFAIRKKNWKLIASDGSGGREKPRGEPGQGWQLYDLKNDPSETKNVFLQNPEIVADLQQELKLILRDDHPQLNK